MQSMMARCEMAQRSHHQANSGSCFRCQQEHPRVSSDATTSRHPSMPTPPYICQNAPCHPVKTTRIISTTSVASPSSMAVHRLASIDKHTSRPLPPRGTYDRRVLRTAWTASSTSTCPRSLPYETRARFELHVHDIRYPKARRRRCTSHTNGRTPRPRHTCQWRRSPTPARRRDTAERS